MQIQFVKEKISKQRSRCVLAIQSTVIVGLNRSIHGGSPVNITVNIDRENDGSKRQHLHTLLLYSSQSNPLVPFSRQVSLRSMGQMTHLFLRFPMNSCSPIKANTLRQNTVKIITSESFFTDWIRAPTIVFRPGNRKQTSNDIYVETQT